MSLPQRLHKVCVLLWRLPKDEVPLAIWRSVGDACYQILSDVFERTHLGLIGLSIWRKVSNGGSRFGLWKDLYIPLCCQDIKSIICLFKGLYEYHFISTRLIYWTSTCEILAKSSLRTERTSRH